MIPLGYMAKRVALKPDWLKTDKVDDILSVSPCMSEDFADWVSYWKHNGFWFFDSTSVIQDLVHEHRIDNADLRWFYFEGYEQEYDEDQDVWRDYEPEGSFTTSVREPAEPRLMGYDIVTFSGGTSAECSPLSCNGLAESLDLNRHCLFETFKEAKDLIESERLDGCEPGPYRIVGVYEVAPPSGLKTETA